MAGRASGQPGLGRLGLAAWIVLAAAQIFIPLTDRRAGPTVIVVLAATVTAWAWAATAWGRSRAVAVLAWVVGATLLVEWVGSTTGFPFGRYRYTEVLQPQVAGVPLIVPLAWFAVGVPALEVAARLTGSRIGGRTWLVRAVVAALALTAWDLFLDPQMVGEGYWIWEGGGAYRDIPLSNYVGWLGSSLVVLAVADRIVGGGRAATDVVAGAGRSLPLLCLYTWWAVMQTVGFVFFFNDALVGLVGGIAMGVPTALAWRRQVVVRGLVALRG